MMEFQKPDKKIIDANLKDLIDLKTKAEETLKKLKEQRELLVKERDGRMGTEDPSCKWCS